MAKPVPQTMAQLAFVLSDIASSAHALKRLALELQDPENDGDIDAYVTGITALAERVGLLADWSSMSIPCGCGAAYGSNVEDWMMPPAWHDLARKSEVRNG